MELPLEEMVGAVLPTNQPNVLLAALEKDVVLIDYKVAWNVLGSKPVRMSEMELPVTSFE